MKSRKKTITIVLVIYPGDLSNFKFLARSIYMYMKNIEIIEINIFVNTIYEDIVINNIKSQIRYFESLANTVKIITGDQLFQNKKLQIDSHFLNRLLLNYPLLQLKYGKGWEHSDGWRMQQAFKLASVKLSSAEYTLFIDAKNIFIRDIYYDDIIDDSGKPRARLSNPNELHEVWLPPSLRAMRLNVNYKKKKLTHFVTPFIVSNSILAGALDELERINGPVEAFFANRFIKATEFMIINAYCIKRFENVEAVFSDGMIRSYTLFAGHSDELQNRILIEAKEMNGKCIGIHSIVAKNISNSNLTLLSEIIRDSGVASQAEVFDSFSPPRRD